MRKDKMKRESRNPQHDHSRGTRPSEITSEMLSFFSSNSPKQSQTRLGENSLSSIPTRLNMRRDRGIILDIIGRIGGNRKP